METRRNGIIVILLIFFITFSIGFISIKKYNTLYTFSEITNAKNKQVTNVLDKDGTNLDSQKILTKTSKKSPTSKQSKGEGWVSILF